MKYLWKVMWCGIVWKWIRIHGLGLVYNKRHRLEQQQQISKLYWEQNAAGISDFVELPLRFIHNISKQNQRFISGQSVSSVLFFCDRASVWAHPLLRMSAMKTKRKYYLLWWHFMTSFHSVHVVLCARSKRRALPHIPFSHNDALIKVRPSVMETVNKS